MPPNGRDSAYASPLGRRRLHKFGISRIHAILIVRIKEVETRIQFILIIFILPVKTALLAAAPRPLLMNKPSLQNCNERPERSNMAKKSRTFYCAPSRIPKIFYVRWPSAWLARSAAGRGWDGPRRKVLGSRGNEAWKDRR